MEFELRKWLDADAKSVQKYANNKKIADNLRNSFPYPYTLKDAAEYIESFSKSEEKSFCRAISVEGEAVGSVGIFLKDDVYCKSAEIGYWLAEPFWGNGIMSEAVKRICNAAFETYDIVRIFAEPYAYNNGSRRVLEKAGFTLEGILKKSVFKNDKIFDSCIYALVKQ
ncbi:MAG: GNAT family N-acetyltransferase [Bacillota bacterium]|nr:GNAT family N-acetyltransferase [Bacillota bacterium]